MGTLNAIYIRSAVPIETIDASWPTAYTEPGSGFFAIDLPPDHFDCPSDRLAALSGVLDTDVLWITFQSAADAFAYHHWKSGYLQRSLEHGMLEQGIWEKVEGETEPWEREAFFQPRQLARLLEDAGSEQERTTTKRLFDQQILELGSWLPMVDARESARAIAAHYALPGWQ